MSSVLGTRQHHSHQYSQWGILDKAQVLHSAGWHCVPHILHSPPWGLVSVPSLNVTPADFSSVGSIWQFLHCYAYV